MAVDNFNGGFEKAFGKSMGNMVKEQGKHFGQKKLEEMFDVGGIWDN